ncbi:MAG: SLOG family protein [Candidatus Spyradocola sp.]|nr:SLOG family protein [Candidatus Spyradocola sp.]
MERTACFTGHRPREVMAFEPLDARCERLTEAFDREVQRLVQQQRVDMFLCGMADGFDLFAAQRLLWLRRMDRIPQGVCLIAVLPYPGHIRSMPRKRWTEAYQEVLLCAQDALVVSAEYGPEAYKKRNAYMVEHARYVLAFWNHSPRSGTGQTVRMAEKSGRTIVNLYDLC